jgi:hypothetical protein
MARDHREVMEQERIQFSAKFDSPFFGPVTESPVAGVRDVIVCPNDQSVEDGVDEYREHPPIASPAIFRQEGAAPPVELGRRVRIDRLSREDQELVMNACTPRGHNFAPIRQFGQRYSFVLDVDPAEYEEHPFRWDRDGVLYNAFTLSRLVRDHAYSLEYAARIVDFEDGTQTVIYTTIAPGRKAAYRLRRDREWLDPAEGAELRDLLAAYWEAKLSPLTRVGKAIWRAEYATSIAWGDLSVPFLASGLECLLKTERYKATRQFVARVPALAAEVGVDGVDEDLAERIYDARSSWIHGAHVELFSGKGQDSEGPATREQWEVFAEIARVQDVLRAAVRRSIEDREFREIFADDDSIRRRWPLN